MFIDILLAVICAKIKGFRIRPIIKAYSLYPYVAVILLYLFLQANVFMGNYSYLKYASIYKSVYLYTLIIPLIAYRLYKPGFYGSIFIIIGTILNKFVMSQNGGKMPVYATLSKLTGYFNESSIKAADNIHTIGNAATKYKFLTDYIDIGYCILSIGDIFIHSFTFLVIYHVIKEINKGVVYTEGSRKGNIKWRHSS